MTAPTALSPRTPVRFTNTGLPDVIELKNVSQSYDDGKTFVLKDLDLLIEDHKDRGQFVVILGKSGCGKSTLLRYVAGLQKPTSGDVLVNGKLLTNHVVTGMVFQQYSSFPWLSALENIALPLRWQGVPKKVALAQAMQMVKAVGLDGHENQYAKYPVMSGGQLQRVAIARSLIANAQILLMDEPFGALDTYTRSRMQELLTGLWSKLKSTIVFVTHDIQEAVFLGQEIYVMGGSPARIIEKVDVDLPSVRTRAMKHEPRFNEIVGRVEDMIMNMGA
jgi:NitT/TauT family transport system ATP-binding protein